MGSDEYQSPLPEKLLQPQEEEEHHPWIDLRQKSSNQLDNLHKYTLYETRSNFYMIGCDKGRTVWRVLKIDRLEALELNIVEDPAIYSDVECRLLLQTIDDGNKSTGGLKFVTVCYGIVGFVKFLGPYYMLLITKRRKVGKICGHAVYSISKSNMIPIPNSTVLSNMAYSKNENRYKKLLSAVDLTKDFYFSYSYNIMLSLQKNLGNHENALDLYETMFVWNEYLTRGIRNQLKNTTWTVALILGFFKQVQLLASEKSFVLTLIARRSRHYAGTRYLTRGVDEKGCVANDVETEQIVFEDGSEACSTPISSIVQNRGSIPLFWSQETSRLNIKPAIILSKKDPNYEATKLHFENLAERYGNPVIIMNLVKTNEKKPRESILRVEFANAIEFINKDMPEKDHLKFLHWDLNKSTKNSPDVLERMVHVTSYALDLTGYFYCERAPSSKNEDLMNWSYFDSKNWDCAKKEVYEMKSAAEELVAEVHQGRSSAGGYQQQQPLMFQNGVLRTNCIDCLDRTNVAQFAYGLVALGRQLYALGLIDAYNIDINSPLADILMKIYEEMGDTLALQYGGSPAHKKIFAEKRGQWKAATRSQEFFRTLQRYYSNVYMDAEKQDSINVFLGHFQPQLGKAALWEVHADQDYDAGKHASDLTVENSRFMRSLSDGNIPRESKSPVEDSNVERNQDSDQRSSRKCLLGSTSEISACESELDCSRSTPSASCRKLYPVSEPDLETDVTYIDERESFDYSNFLDFEWLSSSGNSIEEETSYEITTLISATSSDLASYANSIQSKDERNSSAYASTSGLKGPEPSSSHITFQDPEPSTSHSDAGAEQNEFSEHFMNWVEGDLPFL